ncbi:MAG: hypothetical protein RL336_1572 [Pseudomonadota bacterium]
MNITPPHSNNIAIYKKVSIALVFAAVGALANLFPFGVGEHLELLFGNIAFLVIASFFSPWYAIPVATATLLASVGAGLSQISATIYLVEALVVSLARMRGVPVLISSSVLWLIVSLPLIVIFQRGQLSVTSWLACLELLVNGLLMAAMAQLIVDGLQLSRLSPFQHPAGIPKESLATVLVRVLCALSILLSLSVGFSLNYGFEKRLATTQQQYLQREASLLASVLEEYLQTHVAVIERLARKMVDLDHQQGQSMLLNVQYSRPGFITMLTADEKGNIVQAAPESILAELTDNAFKVIDRDYFTEPFKSKASYVSDPFLGRGFGRDVIVAISAPILDSQDNVRGIVEGSLDLKLIGRFKNFEANANKNKLVITDGRDRVLYAQEELNLKELAAFNLTRRADGNRYIDSNGEAYTVADAQVSSDWRVYVLHPNTSNLVEILQHFTSLFVTLFFIILVAIVISKRIASSLSAPIVALVDEIRRSPNTLTNGAELVVDIEEIDALYSSYHASKRQIVRQQQQLETQVKRRTQDLRNANNQLSRVASVDALTGLANERALIERFVMLRSVVHRNQGQLLSLCVDIDYFKRVNDTYGHEIGDQCLARMGSVLGDCFQRHYDIVAHLGGDEFVIITQVFDWRRLKEYIEACRLKIESTAMGVVANKDIRLSVSIGGFMAPADWSMSCPDWLVLAKQARDEAKKQGRNCLVMQQSYPSLPVPLPSQRLAIGGDVHSGALNIAALHPQQLRERFDELRATLDRTGSALMVMKIAAAEAEDQLPCADMQACKKLMEIFRRGYDTLAMINDDECLVITAVNSATEAEVIIERSLTYLSEQYSRELAIGAVAANASWSSDFAAWLDMCEQALADVTPQQTKRYQLLSISA